MKLILGVFPISRLAVAPCLFLSGAGCGSAFLERVSDVFILLCGLVALAWLFQPGPFSLAPAAKLMQGRGRQQSEVHAVAGEAWA